MKKKSLKMFVWTASLFIVFVIYTICVKFVDVSAIGPNGSSVGLSHLNDFVHDLFGVNFVLYNITDWCELLAFLPALVFAVIGVAQWIKRKDITKADKNILALGIFYIVTGVTYILFEFVVINRRPVLVEGILEASYPSSTTMLSITFFGSLLHQCDVYIQKKPLRISLKVACVLFSAFLVVGRLVSGVHWLTDIVGAMIASAMLLSLYFGIYFWFKHLENKNKSK